MCVCLLLPAWLRVRVLCYWSVSSLCLCSVGRELSVERTLCRAVKKILPKFRQLLVLPVKAGKIQTSPENFGFDELCQKNRICLNFIRIWIFNLKSNNLSFFFQISAENWPKFLVTGGNQSYHYPPNFFSTGSLIPTSVSFPCPWMKRREDSPCRPFSKPFNFILFRRKSAHFFFAKYIYFDALRRLQT